MSQPSPVIRRHHYEVIEECEVDGFTLPKGAKYSGYSHSLGLPYMGQVVPLDFDYFIELTKDDLKSLGSEGEGVVVNVTLAVKAGKIRSLYQ
jgi:hypothetical protein